MQNVLQILVLALVFLWAPAMTSAAITVPAGSHPALQWNVTGGYILPGPGYVTAICVGGADVAAGASVYNEWSGTVRTGSGSHRFVGAFSVPGGPYQFRCSMSHGLVGADTITVTPAPVNGAVGPADSVPTPRVPTVGLCNSGIPSVVTTTATEYTWQCLGTNGGTTDITGNAPRITAAFFAIPSCDIPSLGSTCQAAVTFTSSNAVAVDLKDDAGVLLGTYPVGPQSATVLVPYNFRNLRIFDNATQVQLASVTATAACIFQTTWNGFSCFPNAGVPGAPNVTVTPSMVNPGQSATLTVTPTTGSPTIYSVFYPGTSTTIPGGLNRSLTLPTLGTPAAGPVNQAYEVSVRNAVTFSPRTTAIVQVNSAPYFYPTIDGVTPVGTGIAGSNNQVLATALTGNSFNIPFLMAVDMEGHAFTYTWQFVSGPTIPTFVNGVNARSQIVGNLNSSATYNLNLIATDSMGLSRALPVTLTTTVPPPVITTSVNSMPSPLTIPNATPFTLIMNSSYGATGVWSRTTNGVADWTNQPIPVANGGPLQYNSGALVFAGQPATTTYVWTFTITNAVGVARAASYSLTILPALPSVSVLPPPGSTNYGSVPVGSTASIPFTVTNSGPSGSLLSGVAQSSDPHFTCGSTCAYNNVPAGGTATVTFTYTPTGPPYASHSTTLTFTNTQGPSVTAGIPGSVVGTAVSPIQFGPATGLDFGTVVVGKDKVMTITIRNLSTSLIPAFSLTSNAPVVSQFTCTSGCGSATLAAGATRTVTYTFTPTEPPPAGTPLSQVVSLTGTDRTETFVLTGTAALPMFDVVEQ